MVAKQKWESEPFYDGMKVIKQIADAGFIPDNDLGITFGQALSLFQNDQMGFYNNGAWTLANDITAEGVDPNFRNKLAFTPHPGFYGVRLMQGWVATRSGLNNSLQRDKAKLEAGLAFMEFFTCKESAERFVSMAHSPSGVKVDVTEEMAGPLLTKFMKSREMATGVFLPPNSPASYAKNSDKLLGDSIAAIIEGASAEQALKTYADNLRL
jgi:ABC-type glycerol-3-phosphate transport system substrate-binding protein